MEKDSLRGNVTPYKVIGEADIAWTKNTYSLLNFKEKRNQMFSYKNNLEYGKAGFIDILFCCLRNSNIKLYEDANFQKKINDFGYIPNFERVATIEINNPGTGIPEDKIVMKARDLNDIVALKIKEEWFIDKNFNLLDARIIGLCPIIIERDTAGAFVKIKEMFWIYYPDLRNLLVYADILNKANPNDKITWDYIFIKHFYTGSIVKESNTKDRKITDYRTGKEAKLESEQINGTTQDMNMDLMDY